MPVALGQLGEGILTDSLHSLSNGLFDGSRSRRGGVSPPNKDYVRDFTTEIPGNTGRVHLTLSLLGFLHAS